MARFQAGFGGVAGSPGHSLSLRGDGSEAHSF